MTHVIELTDEQYEAIESVAQEQGVTPQVYMEMLVESIQKPKRVYADLDDFFRSLGASEEEIAQSQQGVDAHFPPDDPPNGNAPSKP